MREATVREAQARESRSFSLLYLCSEVIQRRKEGGYSRLSDKSEKLKK